MMKKLIVLTLILTAVVTRAQNKPAVYDSVLAKKLKGDSHGMKSFVIAVLKTGPNDSLYKGAARDSMFSGHMRNINKLAEEGKLVLAGPFGKNNLAYRGIFILNTKIIEEARSFCEADPTIKAGIFVIDYLPWYGSAAVMEINDIHNRIQKPKK